MMLDGRDCERGMAAFRSSRVSFSVNEGEFIGILATMAWARPRS